jgi:hypothetical protein
MADIKVNKAQWDSVTDDDKKKIIDGLRTTGALKDGDKITGDANTAAFTKDTNLHPLWNPLKDVCKAACDSAAVAAVAWCTANTAGVGLVACLAAAEAARQECHRKCDNI